MGMRITGGEYGGRPLRAPRGQSVRPTQDRVREALFSMLAAEIPGSRFLDLYAGSGAVGLEALSRGAAEVVWVEADRAVCRLTQENITRLAGAGRRVICADVSGWLRRAGHDARFDIVYADPPYELARERGLGWLAEALRAGGTVAPGGVFVAEQPADRPAESWRGWALLRDRVYGQARLVVSQLQQGEDNA